MSKHIELGVAIILLNNNHVLMGTRLSKYGYGKLAFPGGFHEFGETIEEASIRELKEETGLDISVESLNRDDSKKYIFERITTDRHYIVHYCTVHYSSNMEDLPTIKSQEPDKNGDFNWYNLEDIEKIYKEGNLFSNIDIIRQILD